MIREAQDPAQFIQQVWHERSENSRLSEKENDENDSETFLLFLKTLVEMPSRDLNLIPLEDLGSLYESFLFKQTKQSKPSENREHGVYYTPPSLARYLVEHSLGVFLEGEKEKITRADKASQRRLLSRIYQKTFCDPACGCGIFLMETLKLLHRYYAEFSEITREPSPSAVDIVTRQLFGVDLDEAAVFLAQWSVARLAQQLDGADEIVPFSSLHMVQGESLETQPNGFVWDDFLQSFESLESSQVLESSQPPLGFDFIIGNPPYLTEVRGRRKLFQAIKKQSKIANFYTAKMDLSDAFVYLGLELLKPSGTLAYILPEYWLQRESARPLRRHLWERTFIKELRTFGNQKLFKHAPGHHTSLLILEKSEDSETLDEKPGALSSASRRCLIEIEKPIEQPPFEGGVLLTPGSEKILLGESKTIALLETLCQLPPLLASHNIQQGIVFPQGALRERDWKRLPATIQARCHPHQGIFILNNPESASLSLTAKEQALLKPYGEPRQFKGFTGFQAESLISHHVFYIDNLAKKAIEKRPQDFPNLVEHLLQFETINTSAHRPYGLHRPRQSVWFESPHKILCLRQTQEPAFAVIKEVAYVNEGFYVLQPAGEISLDVYTALLNSSVAHFWFYHQKRKGHRLQVDKEVLLSFPRPFLMSISKAWQDEVQVLSQAICHQKNQKKANSQRLLSELNQLVFTGYGLTLEESELIQRILKPLRVINSRKGLED